MSTEKKTKKTSSSIKGLRTQLSRNFYSDISIEGTLYAKLVRSPADSGILKSVSIESIPEDCCLITAENFPGRNSIETFGFSSEIFCSKAILYKGQPLGIITSPDEKTLEELFQSVKIEIEDNGVEPDSKIIASRIIKTGKANDKEEFEKIFESAEYDISSTWSHKQNTFSYNETNGAICFLDKGILNICTPTQWPHHLIRNITEVFNLDKESILIKKTNSASPHTNTLWGNTILVAQTVAAVLKTGRPVKLEFSREEQRKYMTNKMPVIISHRTALDASGKINAVKINITFDAGAQNPFAGEIIDRLAIAATNIYEFENMEIETVATSSANPPSAINIETIDAQAFFAIENQMQKICSETGFSPVDLRVENSAILKMQKSKMPYTLKIEKGEQALRAAASTSDFLRHFVTYRIDSKNAFEDAKNYAPYNVPLRGTALSCAYDASGYFGTSIFECNQKMEVTLEADGSVTIHAISPSQVILEIWKSQVSEILKIDPKQIHINSEFDIKDEPLIPENVYSNVSIMTQLLKKCCLGIEAKRFREPLPIKVTKSISYAQKKQWNKETFTGIPFHSTSFAAAVLELQVDPCTFELDIKKINLIVSAGKILSGKTASTSLRLEVHKVLSQIVETEIFDCNDISITFVQSEEEPVHIGGLIKKVIPAAFSSALSQALGKDINSLPIKSDTIYKIISSGNKTEPAIEKEKKAEE